MLAVSVEADHPLRAHTGHALLRQQSIAGPRKSASLRKAFCVWPAAVTHSEDGASGTEVLQVFLHGHVRMAIPSQVLLRSMALGLSPGSVLLRSCWATGRISLAPRRPK